GWPDLACGLYLSLLAFDHEERRVLAIGRGDAAAARGRAEQALGWLAAAASPPTAGVLAASFEPASPASAYREAVRAVKAAIEAGEIFQANIARAWGGRLAGGSTP